VFRDTQHAADLFSLGEPGNIYTRSDRLYPLAQQAELAVLIPSADRLRVIESPYGHDGFLIETGQVAALVEELLDRPLTSPGSR